MSFHLPHPFLLVTNYWTEYKSSNDRSLAHFSSHRRQRCPTRCLRRRRSRRRRLPRTSTHSSSSMPTRRSSKPRPQTDLHMRNRLRNDNDCHPIRDHRKRTRTESSMRRRRTCQAQAATGTPTLHPLHNSSRRTLRVNTLHHRRAASTLPSRTRTSSYHGSRSLRHLRLPCSRLSPGRV